MKIKICGLQSINDINYVNGVDIDYAGFIFVESSKRKITLQQAFTMKTALSPTIKSVGVFRNENIKVIADIAKTKLIDVIQLHGEENNEYIKSLKEATQLPIIKAYRIHDNIENSPADYILFDSSSNGEFGGTGKTFNWNLIPPTDKKIILAGGLNIDNIECAIKEVKPYCVDINSGVEINGKKNHQKIIEIVQKIRNL